MSNDLNNIPTPNNENKNNRQQLLHDLNNHIFESEAAEITEQHFDSEAAEGLANVPITQVNKIVKNINKELQKKVQKKQKRIKQLPNQQAAYLTIITILLLIIIAYIVIKKVLA